MLTEPKSWLDVLLVAMGITALVLGHMYPHLAPYHFIVAALLLAIESVRLLKRLDA